MLQLFLNDVFKAIFFLGQPVTFLCSRSVHQNHQVVFLLFDGHLTANFDATKLPHFLVLDPYSYNYNTVR